MSLLFSPVRLGEIELANRIVMAPMTRDRAGPDDAPTAVMAEYYGQRASAGLIVTEGTQPSPEGKGYWRTPGVYNQSQIEGWASVVDAVHAAGGKIVIQLMHCGRVGVAANKAGAETVAPSAIPCPDKIPGPDGALQATDAPRALRTEEIAGVIETFAQAAINARRAGADGVELHCASGYLPMQFLSSNSNQRTDQYGGVVANRIRFVIEMLEAMAAAIGAARVGFRICPGNTLNGMADRNPVETYSALLRAANPIGLAYLHLIRIPLEGGDALKLTHDHWTGALILNNNLDFESATQLVEAGQADAVSFGRPFIANPDLVDRWRRGAPLARADRATFYTGLGDDRRGYSDYPRFDGDLRDQST